MLELSEHWNYDEVKDALLDLRQFSATETPLKTMKNVFHLTFKALFVLKIYKFLSWLFGHMEKRLDQNNKVNFKIYDVTSWETGNCNTHIAQYLKK